MQGVKAVPGKVSRDSCKGLPRATLGLDRALVNSTFLFGVVVWLNCPSLNNL